MTAVIPAPVLAVATAIKAGDYDGFVAQFAHEGLVNDWGTVKRGHAGVRSWAQSDAIGAGATMKITSAETKDEVTEIHFDWKSSVFTGDGHAFVTVVDGLITEFRIVE